MSRRKLDPNGNWRDTVVSFCLSKEETNLLNRMVHISGNTKRDYLTARVMERDVVVQGNPKVYKALKDELAAVREELSRIAAGEEISPYLQELIWYIGSIMDGMKKESDWR